MCGGGALVHSRFAPDPPIRAHRCLGPACTGPGRVLDSGPAMETDPLLTSLNDEQRRAVTTVDGALLVLAGAGSGKTRVITHRIAWLIASGKARPWQILAMTFTNKAAGEMKERIVRLLGESANDLWLGTFHSVGVRLLRQLAGYANLQPSFTIYDADDSLRATGRAMKALGLSDKLVPPKRVQHFIDRAKNRCLLPDDPRLAALPDARRDRLFIDAYKAYEDELRRANAVDFGDLLLRPVQALHAHKDVCAQLSQRFRYVLVDEFQDTNFAQFELLKLLTSAHGNLCVVGDDDQSIYSWRGAEVSNILGFPTQFAGAGVVKLERNYRSTATILAASTAVVQRNAGRHGKVLWTEAGAGDPIVVHVAGGDRDEAEWVAKRVAALRGKVGLDEIAVFYRANALSRVIEDALRASRLPYVVIGGFRFFERAEVKDALAWFRAVLCPDDTEGFLRAVQNPKRGVGDTTLEGLGDRARRDGISVPAAARRSLDDGTAGRSRAKLTEFFAVVDRLRVAAETDAAPVVGARILKASGLQQALEAEDTQEATDRVQNLQELLRALEEHAGTAEDRTLRGFLARTALVADTDQLGDGQGRVSMMTVHAAKGLEYDAVFVVGLEDGLLPHQNAIADEGRDGGLEEERRLFYVAMTRARRWLHLSYARQRRRFGGAPIETTPSRFLQDVPTDLCVLDDGWGPARPLARSTAWLRERTAQEEPSFARGAWGPAGRWGAPSRPPAAVSVPVRAGGVTRPLGIGLRAPDLHATDPDDGPADDAPAIQRGEAPSYQRGSRVRHAGFGLGQVVEVDDTGANLKLTVQFRLAGTKRLDARYVRPA